MTKVADVQRIVGEYYGVGKLQMIGRTRAVAIPRSVAMMLSRDFTDMSWALLGVMFGARDHSTVYRAVKAIRDNAQIVAHVEELRRRLVSPP